LPTLDGDNWRNQGSATPKIAGEVVKSSWLRIQSANRVFGLFWSDTYVWLRREDTGHGLSLR
jgi:hypothetical protein